MFRASLVAFISFRLLSNTRYVQKHTVIKICVSFDSLCLLLNTGSYVFGLNILYSYLHSNMQIYILQYNHDRIQKYVFDK